MVPDEYEISLVVERNDLPPFELRLMREKRAQETAHPSSESRRKVVQNDLGNMSGWLAVAGNFRARKEAAHLEKRGGTYRQVSHQEAVAHLLLLRQNKQMSESFADRELGHLHDFVLSCRLKKFK